MKNLKCKCGSTMEYSHTKTRDIIDYIPVATIEIRRKIHMHVCPTCKNIREAEKIYQNLTRTVKYPH